MWQPTMCSVLCAVFLLSVVSVETAAALKVKGAFKDLIQRESAKVSWNLSALNISSLKILENLKHYEDNTLSSTVKGLRSSNGSCSDAVGRTFFQIFEGELWALKSK